MKLLTFTFITLALLAFGLSIPVQGAAPVHVLTLDTDIEPTVANYIENGIQNAEKAGAAAVLIEIDTPGGLYSSMKDIVRAELNATVPVIAYVTPNGGSADSAGVAVVMAANIAAMSPATNIGSAHPIFSTPIPSSDDTKTSEGYLLEKAENDAVQYFQVIAKERGRNTKWAEQVVRKSVNVSSDEAVKLNVVNFVATDIRDVLAKADGMKVRTADGEVTLHIKNAPIERYPMPWYKLLLHFLANGQVAFILLLIAIYGIIFEINTPGATFPGVIGGIALILFLYSISVLPVNYAGMILIVLSIILFIADIKVPTHGVLTVGGILAFFFGAIIVFGTDSPVVGVSIAVLAAGTLATAGFFIFLVGMGVRALRMPVVTGSSGIIGQIVVAKTDIDPVGKVFIEGAWWNAETDDMPIKMGERVKVVGMEGLKLKVKKEENE